MTEPQEDEKPKCPYIASGHGDEPPTLRLLQPRFWMAPIRTKWKRRSIALTAVGTLIPMASAWAFKTSLPLTLLAGALGFVAAAAIALDRYARELQATFVHHEKIDRQGKQALMPMHHPVRTLWEMISAAWRNPRTIEIERMHRHGPIYALHSGTTPIVMVTSPHLAKEISSRYELFSKSDPRELGMPFYFKWVGNNNIVLAKGRHWRHLRSRIMPALGATTDFLPIFKSNAKYFIETLRSVLHYDAAPRSKIVRLSRLLKAVSLDNAGQALFTYDFRHLHGARNRGVLAADYVLSEVFSPARRMLPLLNVLPTLSNRRLRRSMGHLDSLVAELIATFRSRQPTQDGRPRSVLEILVQDTERGALSEHELRNNILAMLVASHETTQAALGADLYFLAKYPNHQERLRDEVQRLFPDLENDLDALCSPNHAARSATLRKLQHFRALDHFILECLRLHSPLSIQNVRTTSADCELDGYAIPKGTLVTINIHALHMNPEAWPDPLRFEPRRFEQCDAETRSAYMTFGAGARACAGRNFTIIEQKIIICLLLWHFRVDLPRASYRLPIQATSFTGQHKSSFRLRFTEITPCNLRPRASQASPKRQNLPPATTPT